MRSTAAKRIFEHWKSLCGAAQAPDRGAIDPSALGSALGDIFLLERKQGKVSFRLAGTRVCNVFGQELRGVAFNTIFDHTAIEDVDQIVADVFDEQIVIVAAVSALFPERISLEGELLLLPLTNHAAHDGSDRMLGMLSVAVHRPTAQPACLALDLISFRVISPQDVAESGDRGQQARRRDAVDLAAMRRARFVVHDGGIQ